MMSKLNTIFCCLLVSSCVCHIDPFTISVGDASVGIAGSDFPCGREGDFIKAAELTAGVLFSERFFAELSDYMEGGITDGPHKAAWEGWDAGMIVGLMRERMDGAHVDTYGGIRGWWLYVFYGNIAFDGSDDGPIRYNRVPLRKRSVPQISNTLAHELAHRIGLRHPHSDDDLGIAAKEPPYVIGDMVERLVGERMGGTE